MKEVIMPDYHVVLQIELSLTARNKDQAWKRANQIESEVGLMPIKLPRWRLGDIECVNPIQVEVLD